MSDWNLIANFTNAQLLDWANDQSWAAAMQKCIQDSEWHAEGDVWTHTKMVLRELWDMPEFGGLSRQDQLILNFTALFHDSGKPQTTVIEESTGRVRSPKHAARGARIAREHLIHLGCDLETREHICHLVLFHGRPPHYGTRIPPEHDVIRVSPYLSNQLLCIFCLADIRGRICKSKWKAEENIAMWRIEAEESLCLTGVYPFKNDHARFLYFRDSIDNLHYQPHEEFRCKMTLMSGLPGAGKDSWLKCNHPDANVVSLDAIRDELGVAPSDNQGRVVQAAREQCREFLRRNTDFVLNATNLSRQIRRLWIDVAADYHAEVEIVYIEPSINTILDQNQSRRDLERVPKQVIKDMLKKLEPPTIAECHRIRFVTND